uniref:C2H2-type domain-containing protein n=1 Tax=Anopheles epiroticus TaxID=199890 RepID=A0A182PWY2_9DIPT
MVKEMPSSTVVNRDEECLKKSLIEVVKSDSSNLCRLCLSKEQKLTRAFSDERGIDDALLKKIFDCTTVKVKLTSIFPCAICAVCDLKLNEFYKFREKCIENDTILHNLLDDRVPEVDQSVPIVQEQQHRAQLKCNGNAGPHGKPSQTEQQAATSTTSSIPEAQKRNNSEMMAIALNQLSSFGLRPLQELMVERNGIIDNHHGLVETSSTSLLPTNGGGNVVSSSSSAPSHDASGAPPSLISSLERLESFDCRLCPGTFASYDLLEEHARNAHQDMQDLQPEEQMIDAASFVKIELEDGELSSSMVAAEGDVDTTTHNNNNNNNNEEGGNCEGRQPVDRCRSSAEELHLTELYQTQQMLELLEKQLQTGQVAIEPGVGVNGNGMVDPASTHTEMTVKRELLEQQYQQQPQEVKEEPLDDSMEIDPSELLQQAMEETVEGNEDSEGGDKQFSSTSSSDDSSSPSTMILFRCDYCMKIFHFLDELNAHMLLHNGAKSNGGSGGAIMLGSAAVPNTTITTLSSTTSPSKPMPLLTLVRPESSMPLLPTNGLLTKPASKPSRKPKRRRNNATVPKAEQPAGTMPGTVNASVPVPPPEHVCSKCPKMFRTEELKRVHEATHANDAQANKVRSCRICNKLFKCELNLLAHMRKHSLTIHHHHHQDTSMEGEPGAGDSSGNDESCSSSSNVGGVLTSVTTQESSTHQSFPQEESDEGETGASDAASPESDPSGGDPTSLSVLSRNAFRKCEICAITFKDMVALDKHML